MATVTAIQERQLAFDYGEIPAADAKALERHAESVLKIQERQRRMSVENALKLGEELAAAQSKLSNHGNGTFGKWCKERLGMSRMTAYNIIQLFNRVPEKDCQTVLQSFDLTALYRLLADTSPEEAYKDALKIAKKGEPVTAKLAREIINSHTVDVDGSDADASPTNGDDSDWNMEPADLDGEWNQAACTMSLRPVVAKWAKLCPPRELPDLAQLLRDLAAQVEKGNWNER